MRDRIFIIFAHYNLFGYYSANVRNEHTGDSTVFLSIEGGEKVG